MSSENPVEKCPRCGHEEKHLKRLTPLPLNWKRVNDNRWTAKEGLLEFTLLRGGGFYTCSVSKHGRVLKHVEELGSPHRELVELKIHEWYTDRFHEYLSMKEEFQDISTYEFE